MTESAEDRIPTNLRTLLILEVMGLQSEALTPAQLGRHIGLPKQTIHRLCNTLLEEKFLARDDRTGGLRPGRRARELAAGILHASSSHVARHQVLMELAERTGETVNFAVPDTKGMSYRDRVETDWAFRIQLPIGTHVPFHCTASGKTYLASLSKAERKRLVSVMRLERKTKNTITDPDLLLEELNQINRQGYAVDDEEFMDDMVAVSVPVRDPNGRYVASVAFHGPVPRLSMDRARDMVDHVRDAAIKLGAILF